MSEPEHFIARWSRRKRAAAASDDVSGTETGRSVTEVPASEGRPAAEQVPCGPAAVPAGPLADLGKLPPIESIGAGTDVRGFLAPGVPVELSRAALRRAWSADPAIRDFVGLADYDWDFNTPGAIAGFGPLEMTDELRRHVAQILGQGLSPAGGPPGEARSTSLDPAESAEGSRRSDHTTAEASDAAPPSNVASLQDEPSTADNAAHNFDTDSYSSQVSVAAQNRLTDGENVPGRARRPHGRALPK